MFSVVYSAFGRKHITEAAISAWSVKRHMPHIPIYVLTDQHVDYEHFDNIELSLPNDLIEEMSWTGKKNKAQAVLNCQSEACLFVDADTFFTGDVSDVFDSKVDFDLAAVHDTWQFPDIYQMKSPIKRLPQHPQSHPYFNTGVIFFRKNKTTLQLLRDWANACEKDPNDQLAFSDCIYSSNIRIHALPSVYNARAREPIHLSGYLKILHKYSDRDHYDPYLHSTFVADIINSTHFNRIYLPMQERMLITDPVNGPREVKFSDYTMQSENRAFLYPNIEFIR